jgi:uncharacterized protein (DUF2336 family)
MLKGLFGKKDVAKAIKDADVKTRSILAAREDAPADLLFVLAADPAPEVRREVAANVSTPPIVSPVLANDQDLDVRSVLLRRLVRLLPDLKPDQHDELYKLTVQALEKLATDHVRAVREALASTLKDVAFAPLSVVKCLAKDVEQTVAEPVLQLCTALTDEDLLEIIARHPRPWALAAIAGRGNVSASVSNAIVESGDRAAGSILLDNSGAVIEDATLEKMVAEAEISHAPDWQGKLAGRAHLPRRLALRLAEFVDGSVMTLLERRDDFDPETRAEVTTVTRRRLTYLTQMDGKTSPQEAAAKMRTAGLLGDELMLDAISWNDRTFVVAALALLTKINANNIEAILNTKKARVITALAWKAGLSMRVAMQLQTRIAGVDARDVLNARDGNAYPISEDDMLWQLEFVGAIKRAG